MQKRKKYIDAEKITAEIDKIIRGLKGGPMSMMEECRTASEIETLELVKSIISEMKQEEPTPPGIEEESQRKGWLDYGTMMSEIGLHRYNAIRRIKEHKEQFNPLSVPDLYHVAEYYEAVGAELTCCCLQAYGKDFIFTQEEVKEIIEEESQEKGWLASQWTDKERPLQCDTTHQGSQGTVRS